MKSWFRAGFALSVGALLAWHLVDAVLQLTSLLTLLLLAVFIAVGLEPVVAGPERRGLRRGWSVAVVAGSLAVLPADLQPDRIGRTALPARRPYAPVISCDLAGFGVVKVLDLLDLPRTRVRKPSRPPGSRASQSACRRGGGTVGS
ncbi:hypothetical protein [Kitasatospora terrestris]|uniref:Uncharacterized protein n=1 Tax=Kitasatospora terrestris TaxID=258051 RepID=A0ABP9DBE8_9ACTN